MIIDNRRITGLTGDAIAELVTETGPLWHERHRPGHRQPAAPPADRRSALNTTGVNTATTEVLDVSPFVVHGLIIREDACRGSDRGTRALMAPVGPALDVIGAEGSENVMGSSRVERPRDL
ncbi:hypothetical protein C6Y14_27320 [Streptomyces dioscori]|uniref:Uncharacterized protein n=1 Tax=Streptomyces dioscori TaxID=2109333 RepID=A0A2P8Q2C5_9ACTN|nr:hypothetical protein [Streptomyces dioscori]PSM40398.1 hypothetical protein C6Y14_27320 [Streptomyces dioscori]